MTWDLHAAYDSHEGRKVDLVGVLDFTPEALADIATALRWLLRQATKEELSSPAQESYDRVLEWLNDVEPKAKSAVDTGERFQLVTFPLTRAQFRKLQSDIQHIQSGHALRGWRMLLRRPSVPRFMPPTVQESLEHLVTSLDHTRFTSWLIGGGLLILALLNGFEALLFADVSPYAIALINLAAVLALLAIWATHHFHSLTALERRFHFHVAIHHHRLHFLDGHPPIEQ
jgi:hypothetical protein